VTVTRPQCSCQAGTHAIASRCQVLPGFSGMEFRRRPRQHLRAARPAGHLPEDKRHPQTAVDPGGTFPHLPTLEQSATRSVSWRAISLRSVSRMRTSTSGVTSAEGGDEAGPGLVRAVGQSADGDGGGAGNPGAEVLGLFLDVAREIMLSQDWSHRAVSVVMESHTGPGRFSFYGANHPDVIEDDRRASPRRPAGIRGGRPARVHSPGGHRRRPVPVAGVRPRLTRRLHVDHGGRRPACARIQPLEVSWRRAPAPPGCASAGPSGRAAEATPSARCPGGSAGRSPGPAWSAPPRGPEFPRRRAP
jgi:hypothetical protein